MPLVQTRGAASAQGFGEFAQATAANYIEDVFSTYLYTGTGATQTITNNIDLSTKGGLVWVKGRNLSWNHTLYDTVNGVGIGPLNTASTDAPNPANNQRVTAFNSNGFTLGTNANVNGSGYTYASWTFRKQPKFFDVVTYTGTGAARTVSHSLGSVPGCIIFKRTDNISDWATYHRSLNGGTNPQDYYVTLNNTSAQSTSTWFGNTAPTSTVFSVDPSGGATNQSGATYVAYLFAHDAGGFGLTGTDNVISCGSYTGNGSTQQDITLGYEPQWLMIKRTDTTNSWIMVDVMRGLYQTADNALEANSSNAEAAGVSMTGAMQPIATGFHLYNANSAVNASGGTYIYIAIRRGPMKVPTLGTSVYYPFARSGNDTQTNITGVGFTPDLWMVKSRNIAAAFPWFDRLRGVTKRVDSTQTTQEETFSGDNGLITLNMDGITIGSGPVDGGICNDTGTNYGNWLLRRSPSFFDEVCYTGTGSNTTFTHNLGAVPELMIVKRRDTSSAWDSYCSALANTEYVVLNTTAAKATGATRWNSTTPTSSVFSVGTSTTTNASAGTYVAYLFATCAGVSKVGSYTGNGSSQTINCGFTGGARFVLIKATSTTGDWMVADSARGIVAGNDPALYLNSTAAEVTGLDWIDADNSGFVVNETATIAANTNGVSYIFLAVA